VVSQHRAATTLDIVVELNSVTASLLLLQSLTYNVARPASFCSATTTLGLLSDCRTNVASFPPNLLPFGQRRLDSTMSTTSSSSEGPKVRAQRSPLASQRDREAGNRAGAYFPLGYKDGFSQWVRLRLLRSHKLTVQEPANSSESSGQAFHR
jgi:hypothetical protein